MNKKLATATMVVTSFLMTACETPGGARSGTAMSVQYGVVQSVQEVQAESNTVGGSALGGLAGLAVAARTGAKTGLFAIISALSVVLVLLFFTSYLYHLPQAVLAVIVMMVHKILPLLYFVQCSTFIFN